MASREDQARGYVLEEGTVQNRDVTRAASRVRRTRMRRSMRRAELRVDAACASQAGLTQARLAKMVGVSQPMIARMERGLDQRTPRWETLRKVGLALGKQLKLSFVEADGDETLVEVHGMPPRGAALGAERRG
jgi:DNA-binding XRE family transcriptional regulator